MTGDNDGTSTGLFTLFDKVDLVKSLALVGDFELLGKFIVSDAASVNHRLGREYILQKNTACQA